MKKEMVGNHWSKKMKRREHTWWLNYL